MCVKDFRKLQASISEQISQDQCNTYNRLSLGIPNTYYSTATNIKVYVLGVLETLNEGLSDEASIRIPNSLTLEQVVKFLSPSNFVQRT